MWRIDTQQLTRRYIVALTGIAIFAILGQLVVQRALLNHSQDARVINLAGRQRMLSQRICKAALVIQWEHNLESRDQSLKELQEALALWNETHEGLRSGKLHAQGTNSPEIMRLFDAIEADRRQISWAATALLDEANRPESLSLLNTRVSAILKNEGAFLEGMDQVVLRYQHESQLRVTALQQMEYALLGLTVLVLFIEGWLVFRPAVNQIANDITDAARSAEALRLEVAEHRCTANGLRESEAKFKALSERSLVGVYLMQDGTFQYVNPKFAEIFGYSLEDILGKLTPRDLVHPEDRAEVEGNIARRLEGSEGSIHYGFRGLTLQGALRHIEVYGSRTIFKDRPAIIGTLLDVTERKIAEERIAMALSQELALRDIDRRKNEFLAMLAHELRNPLASVLSAATVIKLSEDRASHQWASEVISRQSGQLRRLIDDLLDVSRITSGKVRLQRSVIDLAEVLERALETVRPLCEERAHQLTGDFPRGKMWVNADASRIEQVVVNLLTNSAKYTRNGGRIELLGKSLAGKVEISVRDNGIGILPARLPGVFKLFEQSQQPMVSNQGGLGLGLAIVQHLITVHGGTVHAFSEGLEMGSRFTFFLPVSRHQPSQLKEPPQSMHIPTAQALKILVVDDHVDTAQGLARLLTQNGHQIAVANEGMEALQKARDFKPDVVLLDIGLPNMDGYEVAAALRNMPCCAEATIIAVSGFGQDGDLRRSATAGFNHYLIKPVELSELQELLLATGAKSQTANC